MLAIISPAKTLDFESTCPAHRPTQPQALDDSEELMAVLKKKSRAQLRALMGISEKLADMNFERNQSWSRPFNSDNSRAAILAFKGDVYTGIEVKDYSKDDFKFSQNHLRILSGLYGLLRPLDLIQAYRLEMGTDLKTSRGKNLYEFWGDSITKSLQTSIKKSGSNTLVNLASNEYFKSVQKKDLDCEIVTPHFKDKKNGVYKFMSFYGKKARGMMCDFMIRNRITDPSGLKDFNTAGYSFNKSLSEGYNWVFTREEQAPS